MTDYWANQPDIHPFDFTPTEGATMNGDSDNSGTPAVPPSSAEQGAARTDGPTDPQEPQKGTEGRVVDWEAERLTRWLP